jgi:hypothetical protein
MHESSDESWLHITARVVKTLINSHQNLNQLKVDENDLFSLKGEEIVDFN